MALVLDEPAEGDKVEEVHGMTFLLDAQAAARLEHYLPLRVDYDDRYWHGIRISASRQTARC
jgi:hypothetical protein